MAKRNDIEGPIHKAILHWLQSQFPHAVIHHSPNEMNIKANPTSKAIAQSKAKAMGMLPGFPDLIVLIDEHPFIGLEVKSPKGVVSDNQIAVGEAMVRNGGRWSVVRSVDDVRDLFRAWGLVG